jgi:hypothetical protein
METCLPFIPGAAFRPPPRAELGLAPEYNVESLYAFGQQPSASVEYLTLGLNR